MCVTVSWPGIRPAGDEMAGNPRTPGKTQRPRSVFLSRLKREKMGKTVEYSWNYSKTGIIPAIITNITYYTIISKNHHKVIV